MLGVGCWVRDVGLGVYWTGLVEKRRICWLLDERNPRPPRLETGRPATWEMWLDFVSPGLKSWDSAFPGDSHFSQGPLSTVAASEGGFSTLMHSLRQSWGLPGPCKPGLMVETEQYTESYALDAFPCKGCWTHLLCAFTTRLTLGLPQSASAELCGHPVPRPSSPDPGEWGPRGKTLSPT